MKKDPKDYTQGKAEYDRRRLAVKAGTPNAYTYFKNIAQTGMLDFKEASK